MSENLRGGGNFFDSHCIYRVSFSASPHRCHGSTIELEFQILQGSVVTGLKRVDRLQYQLAVWLSGNIVGHINVVTLRRARLVLRWVTADQATQPTRPTDPGRPSVGRQNEHCRWLWLPLGKKMASSV